MSLRIKQTLKDVTFNVLETMFFCLPEPYEGKDPDQEWDLCSSVKLEGLDSLTLHILLPKALAMKLASDFLGREHDEITAEALLDMMKEMANMIGGNLITRMENSNNLALNIPKVDL
jgi:CheY-specific phosphatase CheX